MIEADGTEMLRHMLATLAYRTQKALNDASEAFGEFEAGGGVRTPKELLRHMTGVLGYARTWFRGGEREQLAPLETLSDEVTRFHETLGDLSEHLANRDPLVDMSYERLLQGPLSDAMTHVGQLAMLRRLAGSPVAPENFILAEVRTDNVSEEQSVRVPGGTGRDRPR